MAPPREPGRRRERYRSGFMKPNDQPTDESLATAAGRGSRDAFEDLVFRYGSAVLAVVERQVGDHHGALDLAQEIWVKVFRAITRFRPDGSFRSWLFSIALNHVRDARRQQARSKVVYMDEFRASPSASRSFDPRGRTEEHAAIEAALAQVPEPFRTALVLIDVMQLSYEEAAGSLSCAVGTVKSRVNRGRFHFRDVYRKTNGDEDPVARPCHPG